MSNYDTMIEKQKRKKSLFARNLVRCLELLAVVLSILGRSRIARFLSTKVTLDVVVEVTDKFGARAGHRLSTFIAAVVAEPMIVAYVVAGVLVVVNLLAFPETHVDESFRIFWKITCAVYEGCIFESKEENTAVERFSDTALVK